jgi:hypothetical protein
VADPALFQELLNRNSLGGAAGLGGEMSLGPGLMRRPPMNVGIGYETFMVPILMQVLIQPLELLTPAQLFHLAKPRKD